MDASLLDRGDSYRVDFLGCAMLKSMATGVGAIQKPLKELYLKHRLPGKDSRLHPGQLTMTDRGILVAFQPGGGARTPPEEVFYGAPSIMFWDAVKFAAVKGPDKKVRGAFEPLDIDHSRSKEKLFAALDKKQYYLQQLVHPAIFTCVLRRTSGVKALDLHAFVCHSDGEALGLVQAFNMVQSNFTSDQVSETGVFGYNPFGKDSVRVAAGPNRTPTRQQPEPSNRWAHGSTPSLDRINESTHQNQHLPVSAVPLPGLGNIRQTDLQRSNSKHKQEDFPRPTTRSKSYHQLTQEDLVPSPDNSLTRNRQEVYEHSEHITGSLDRGEASRSVNPFYQGANSVDRSQSTRTHPPKATTGQGYSLLGSAATPPGYHGPRSRTVEQEQHRTPRDVSPSGYQRTIERTSSRAQQHSLPRSNPEVPSHAESPPRDPVYAQPNRAREAPPPSSSASSSRAIFSQADEHLLHRPVAKVPPHKVTGIKVLPSMPQINLKSESKRKESPTKAAIASSSGNRKWEPSTTPSKDNTTTDGPNPEELLLSQKKDAEIACLMQNIQLDYEPSTLSPHGTNFESALGYFP